MSEGAENKPAEAGKKAAGGRFLPGRSGNPGGRPKALAAFLEQMRAEGPNNAAFLIRTRDDPDAPMASRIEAARIMLDRAFGKPTVGLPDAEGQQVSRVVYGWADEGKAE